MIALFLWIAMGAFVGWLASVIMKTDGAQGILLDIIVGITGAAIGGMVMRSIGAFDANINEVISVYSVLVSLLGAVILLGVVRLFRRALS